MNNNLTPFNAKVTKAGYKYIGHYKYGVLTLQFENFMITINNKSNLKDLFDVFEINCEDGAYLEDLTGKYCVAIMDDQQIVRYLTHLTNPNIVYNIMNN